MYICCLDGYWNTKISSAVRAMSIISPHLEPASAFYANFHSFSEN